MNSIIFTVGPPGAGKTTWARHLVKSKGLHHVHRVNLDDHVRMVSGDPAFADLSAPDLKLAKKMMISSIRAIVESGRDAVVDNTHLSRRFPQQVRDEIGDVVTYEIADFTNVPLDTCLAQDAQRLDLGTSVGADEVTRQWNKGRSLRARLGGDGLPVWADELNLPDGIEPFVADDTLPSAVIVDIDGTLALNKHRSPYDTTRYHTDELEHRLAALLDELDMKIIVLTGRDAKYLPELQEWLGRHDVYFDEIHMRPEGDTRRDDKVKLDLFNEHVRGRFNVIGAFDDRDRVVRLWRRLELMTLQVNYGDF